MKFTKSLIKGKLIRRYKRFFVDIKVNNKVVTAHCPNTGSMMGLLKEGNQVWLTQRADPKRKLKFTLEIIKVNGKLSWSFGINFPLAIISYGSDGGYWENDEYMEEF